MCFVRISEQTATFALQNVKRLVFITEVESVYSAVRMSPYIKQIRFVFKWLKLLTPCTVLINTVNLLHQPHAL
jgi:hypothetical protein